MTAPYPIYLHGEMMRRNGDGIGSIKSDLSKEEIEYLIETVDAEIEILKEANESFDNLFRCMGLCFLVAGIAVALAIFVL